MSVLTLIGFADWHANAHEAPGRAGVKLILGRQGSRSSVALNSELDYTLNTIGMKPTMKRSTQQFGDRFFENFGAISSLNGVTFDHNSAFSPL
jgi:hypothetical protein